MGGVNGGPTWSPEQPMNKKEGLPPSIGGGRPNPPPQMIPQEAGGWGMIRPPPQDNDFFSQQHTQRKKRKREFAPSFQTDEIIPEGVQTGGQTPLTSLSQHGMDSRQEEIEDSRRSQMVQKKLVQTKICVRSWRNLAPTQMTQDGSQNKHQ